MRRLLNIPNKRSNVQPPDTFSGASTVSVYSRWKYFYLESRYFYLGSLYSTPTVTCHNTELITPAAADHNAAFLQIVPSKKQLKISTFNSSNAHNGLPPNHDFSRSQTCTVDYGPSISTFGPIFQQILWKWKTSNFVLLKVSVNYRGFCVLLIILQFYTTMVFITLILYSLYYILSSDTDVIDRDFVQSNIP